METNMTRLRFKKTHQGYATNELFIKKDLYYGYIAIDKKYYYWNVYNSENRKIYWGRTLTLKAAKTCLKDAFRALGATFYDEVRQKD
jgi:hypothetical protein